MGIMKREQYIVFSKEKMYINISRILFGMRKKVIFNEFSELSGKKRSRYENT